MADYTNWSNYKRVLQLARKPEQDELWKISAIAGGGIVLVGFMGFVIYALMTVTPA